jgi:hypothetical protein
VKIRCALVLLSFCFTNVSTQAGPPFVTDDPEPPPPGGWEINVPFILEHESGATEMDAPLFDLNYGLPGIQLKLEIPVEIVHDDSDGTVSGAGDLLLGVKWRFLKLMSTRSCWCQLAITRATLARVNLASSYRSLHRKVGTSGHFTEMWASGGEALMNRATTFTPGHCSNAKSMSDSS